MESDREKKLESATTSTSASTREPSVAMAAEGDDSKNDTKLESVTPDESVEAANDHPKGLAFGLIILALVLSIFLASLDMTIVATAIPKITDEFGGLDKVSWYGSAFFLTNGGFQSSWGKGYKYFPLKITFLASVLVFELGSLVCAVAQNSTTLIVGRAVTGLGAAGIGTGTYTILAFVTEPQERPMYTGFVGVSYGVASVLGPLIGGVFSDKVSWRWCFWVNLPVGGLAALVIIFFFHTPKNAKPIDAPLKEKFLQMDPLGVALMMGALISYVLAVEYGGQSKPWSSSTVIGLLVGCVVIIIIFVIWEIYQQERAMLVPRLVKQRVIAVCSIFTVFFAGSYFATIYYLPIYFQSVHNASPTMSGVYNLPLILAVTIAMISSGIFISSTGLTIPLKVAGSVLALIGSGLIYTFDLNTGLGKWIGFQIIAGVGWGLAYQIPLIVGQSVVGPEDISSVTALNLLCMNLGGTCLVTAAQAIFVNDLIKTLPSNAPGVNPKAVVGTGATKIRSTFSPEEVPGIIESYMGGVKNTLALDVAALGAALIVVSFSKWKRLKTAGSPAVSAA